MREVLSRMAAVGQTWDGGYEGVRSRSWWCGVRFRQSGGARPGEPHAFRHEPARRPARDRAGCRNAAASAPENQTEEIVVTARKRRESIQDIPASVDVISESVIKEAHITQLDDIGSRVSNLNIFEAHDNSPAVVMRGVGSFELVQGVGFYMNDVQLFEGQTVRPMDIARIEVLKGPQGTLYGGNNIGGAIKYVTKDPTSTWQNEVTGKSAIERP